MIQDDVELQVDVQEDEEQVEPNAISA